ncbi:4-phosphopantetheinyl transferase (plasmid) [Candidatus Burkholderia crenata]|nr:4-phosphopantetheinyl transferase [Candidatus Burkholderia crenata]
MGDNGSSAISIQSPPTATGRLACQNVTLLTRRKRRPRSKKIISIRTPAFRLLLCPGETQLWATPATGYSEGQLQAFLAEMDFSERTRADGFRFQRDRMRYIVTRCAIRSVLSRYTDHPPAAWSFMADAFGRPCLVKNESAITGLTFNITHTSLMIVIALSRSDTVGVDAESRERSAPSEVAERFFAASENNALSQLTFEQAAFRFFELWTLKEAYLKAIGVGLSVELNSIVFDFPNSYAIDYSSTSLDSCRDARQWTFSLFHLEPRHIFALCLPAISEFRPLAFSLRIFAPLGDEKHRIISPYRWSR